MVVGSYIHSQLWLYRWIFHERKFGSSVCLQVCVGGQPRPLLACVVWESPACPVRPTHVLSREKDAMGGSALHFRQKDMGEKKESIILDTLMGFPRAEPFIAL